MIAAVLHEVDPDGVAGRSFELNARLRRLPFRSAGPMQSFHGDQFDKAWFFGFPVWGAMCGGCIRIMSHGDMMS